jgi:hypothetical protein
MNSQRPPKKDAYEKGREQEAAQNRGGKVPYYAKETMKALLKPYGSSGKR